MTATVILPNDADRACKSSLARALQDVLSEAWLHVAFLEMFPGRFHEVDMSLADPVACAEGIAFHFGLQCRTGRIG